MNGVHVNNKNPRRVSQTLRIQNGYQYPMNLATTRPQQSVKYTDPLSGLNYMDPAYTYPVLHRPRVVQVKPQFVEYEKLILTYFAEFIETVAFFPEDMNRRRLVKVLYFLEDGTIAVNEGSDTVVRRRRHLKSSPEAGYHWKDLNIGQEIRLNGIRLKIFDCDTFTKNFMTSRGIEVEINDLTDRLQSTALVIPARTVRGSGDDKDILPGGTLKADLVLSFDCQMEIKDNFQKNLTFKLFYNTAKSSVTIKELKENQEGRHKFPFYLRRTKVPKDESSFLTATDLRVGEIVTVFGTRFLITDCDKFTRDHFSLVLRDPQPPKLKTHPFAVTEKRTSRRSLPSYLGRLGSPEDSLSSTFSLWPRTTKMVTTDSDETTLRYNCRLEDECGRRGSFQRRFILHFNVKYGTMTIFELPIDGIMQGRFVTSQRVRKPNTNPDLPEFYSPSDLLVDNVILVNCHRFRITAADNCVYKFMDKYPEKFPKKQGDSETESQRVIYQ